MLLLIFVAFFMRVPVQPFGGAEDRRADAAGRPQSAFLAADDAVVVETHDLLGLAGPEGAAEQVAAHSGTGSVEAEAPAAVAEHALTHSIYFITLVQKQTVGDSPI